MLNGKVKGCTLTKYIVLITVVPTPVSRALIVSHTGQTFGRDDNFVSINEQAECFSHVAVNEERVNVVEEKKSAANDEKKFHGKVI